MAKPNKADYTKDQWRKLKEKIKIAKAEKRAAKAIKVIAPRPLLIILQIVKHFLF